EFVSAISRSQNSMPVFFSGDSSAQKGAFIKMKQENIYTYQRLFVLCCVPIIAPVFSNSYLIFK
ncbi:hypothetical protein FNN94_03535, partial [Salmonella enterica subsp. diarizonae]|nr:hypothetical protein [Salmonella enterica subsp. diarizonae]